MEGYFSSLFTASWKCIVPMKSDGAFEKGKLLLFFKFSIDQGRQTEEGFNLLLHFTNIRNILKPSKDSFICMLIICAF